MNRFHLSRRVFLAGGLTALLTACGAPNLQRPGAGAEASPETAPGAGAGPGSAAPGGAQGGGSATLPPTPACGNDPTPPQTAGPYYTPNTPRRTSLLEAGMKGTRLALTGQVVTRECTPVANALLDFWQADADGVYDNTGYKLRGHQFADESGRFTLETVVPGHYPGRTRHIHVRVQGPNQAVLTTQLYFPGESGNATDAIFRKELVMAVTDGANGKKATFTFVLP